MPPDWPTRTMPLSISLSLSPLPLPLLSSLNADDSPIPFSLHHPFARPFSSPSDYSRIAWAIPPDLLQPTPTDSPHLTLGDNYPHPHSSIAATTIALILTTRFLSPDKQPPYSFRPLHRTRSSPAIRTVTLSHTLAPTSRFLSSGRNSCRPSLSSSRSPFRCAVDPVR